MINIPHPRLLVRVFTIDFKWHSTLWCQLILSLFLTSNEVHSLNFLQKTSRWHAMPVAVLQGLDKITARVSTFQVDINNTAVYGTLKITVRSCRKRPPTEPPESAVFLEIADKKPGQSPVQLFSGWMFASSPALNALEHPVYDIWALDCKSFSTKRRSLGED